MSEIKVNKISPRTNCGTTTLGDSGDTFTIPAGVTITNNGTQTGFGREGSVNWDTTAKTTNFTAVSGNGYFVNTTSGAITVTLPASPSAGDIVSISDYTGTFATNNCTVGRNSSNINGVAEDWIIAINDTSITFVYVDATEGWRVVNTSLPSETQNPFLVATGGTITTCGDFKIHTFTGPGTFTVTQVACTSAENTVGYQVVAGGGAGGTGYYASGGGAGGFREGRNTPVDNFSASPLVADAPTNAVTVTATSYPITVGGGGSASPVDTSAGGNGNNSVFSTITSAGGGGGGSRCQGGPGSPTPPVGARKGGDGGSGGGGTNFAPEDFAASKGSGNTPPVSPSQGNPGGGGGYGGGGGGAGAAAADAPQNSPFGTVGGAGVSSSITGSSVARAGGGGGGSCSTTNRAGGTGGGGTGTGNCGPAPATAGTDNTGGGGGGGSGNPTSSPFKVGGAGGSGIVIIRYKFQ